MEPRQDWRGKVAQEDDVLDMSHREIDDDYDHIIAQLGPKNRVIVCKDNSQWIVQIKRGQEWRSMHFCTSGAGVLRRVKGLPGWESIIDLPARFPAQGYGKPVVGRKDGLGGPHIPQIKETALRREAHMAKWTNLGDLQLAARRKPDRRDHHNQGVDRQRSKAPRIRFANRKGGEDNRADDRDEQRQPDREDDREDVDRR